MGLMTRTDVKAAIERVLTWPPDRQADATHILERMEEQDKSPLRLTDEQAAEVRRRLADPQRKTVSFGEAFKRFQSPKS
jgi:hypothetical protein